MMFKSQTQYVLHPMSTKTSTLDRVSATSHAPHRSVWVSSGRLVSLTLGDPEVKPEIDEFVQELLDDPQKLHEFLLEGGFTTPTGRLAKLYGG
jgi:hypothetical protein